MRALDTSGDPQNHEGTKREHLCRGRRRLGRGRMAGWL